MARFTSPGFVVTAVLAGSCGFGIGTGDGTWSEADAKAPTVPEGLVATRVSQTRIDLAWNPSLDDRGVAGYRVFDGNGAYLKSSSGTGASIYTDSLAVGTSYCFSVSAYDAAGNESARCSPQCASIKVTVSARIAAMLGEGYRLDLVADGDLVTSGSVTGPGVASAPLKQGCFSKATGCWMTTLGWQQTKPAPGDTYLFTLHYSDGSSEALATAVYDLGVAYPAPLAPAGAGVSSLTPTFRWTAPPSGCVSSYRIIVADSQGGSVWNAIVPAAATTVIFNADFGATQALQASASYTWTLLAFDDCADAHPGFDNYAAFASQFTMSAGPSSDKAEVSARMRLSPAGYRLELLADPASAVPITAASATGPGVASLPLAVSCWLEGCRWEAAQDFGASKPRPGDVYSFDLRYGDGSFETLLATVYDLGVGMPFPLAPRAGASVDSLTPTFSWNPPATGCASFYHLIVSDTVGTALWAPHLPSSTTSAIYDFDAKAAAPLVRGGSYSWVVNAIDDCANLHPFHDNLAVGLGGSFSIRQLPPPPPSPPGWLETFESYAEGEFPSPGWTSSGNTAIEVDGSASASGAQSVKLFGVLGACWGALLHRPLAVTAPLSIEFLVRNGAESLSGCHPKRGNIALFTGASWTSPGSRQLISFDGDGKIRGSALPPADGFVGTVLGTYAVNTWTKVKIGYERLSASAVQISYWINDAFVLSEQLPAAALETSLAYLSPQAAEGTAWFDDISVVPGVPIAPGIRPGVAGQAELSPGTREEP